MEFEKVPNEIIQIICKQANLPTLLILSETSWILNQLCHKEIQERKTKYLEEKRIKTLVDKYFEIYKQQDQLTIPLGDYEPFTRHDIELSEGIYPTWITETFAKGEHPILPDLFPDTNGMFFRSPDSSYPEDQSFDVLYLKNSTDENRKTILRKLAEMNIL